MQIVVIIAKKLITCRRFMTCSITRANLILETDADWIKNANNDANGGSGMPVSKINGGI